MVVLIGCAGDDASSCGGQGGTNAAGQGGAGGTGAAGTGMAGLGGTGGISGMGGGMGGAGGGVSACGIMQCQAGQHCFNGVCVNGCLTSDNCASGQTCEDINPDTSIGTCRNRPVAPVKDCDAFCMKAFACQDPEAIFCMDQCIGLSAECVACVVASNCGAGCEAQCAF